MEIRSKVEDHFRERVSAGRKACGWSQAELAKLLTSKGIPGIYATTVAKIESGERAVRINEANALADLLGTTVDDLLGRQEPDDGTLAFAMVNVASYATTALREVITAKEAGGTLEAILNDVNERFDVERAHELLTLAQEATQQLSAVHKIYEHIRSEANEEIRTTE